MERMMVSTEKKDQLSISVARFEEWTFLSNKRNCLEFWSLIFRFYHYVCICYHRYTKSIVGGIFTIKGDVTLSRS